MRKPQSTTCEEFLQVEKERIYDRRNCRTAGQDSRNKGTGANRIREYRKGGLATIPIVSKEYHNFVFVTIDNSIDNCERFDR